MRPPLRALALAGPAALLLALAPSASAVVNVDVFKATVSVQGSTLRVDDQSDSSFSDGELVNVGFIQLDAATLRVLMSGFRNTHDNAIVAGPGCSVTRSNLVDRVVQVDCAAAGVQQLAFAPVTGALGPTATQLLATTVPLPMTASLGTSDDGFTFRQDLVEVVDGGAGTDTLRSLGVREGTNPVRFAGVRYSNDGVANDGYAGHGQSSNFTGFERVTDSGGLPLPGDDVYIGAGDADDFQGGPGDDQLQGNGGDDTLGGSTGADTLKGGAGADRLDGADGADDLDGGTGPDVVTGGGGVDTVTGGPGDDSLMIRDGVKDKVLCDPGSNTYDADLTDDLPKIEQCVVSTVGPSTAIGVQTTKLDVAIRAGNLSALNTFAPPPAPEFGAGAVKEKPNVRIGSRLLVARRGVLRLTLSCPKATTGGCSGTEDLLDLREKRIATGTRHKIAAGKSATVTFTLPASQRSRTGARLVAVRIVEKGKLGPKTSGAVLPLAVPKR